MRKTKAVPLSIRNVIIIVCILLMLAVVGTVCFIIFSNWIISANDTASRMADEFNTQIYKQIDDFLYVPKHINEVNQKLIEDNLIDFENEQQREKYFLGVLESHNHDIYSFSYGTEKGEYYGARRNEKGSIEIMRNNVTTNGHSWYYTVKEDGTAAELVVDAGAFDPRTRTWYKTANSASKPIFSPIYKHFIMDDLTVSAAWPIYNNDGTLKGVLGSHLNLSSIGEFLKRGVKDKKAIAVIIEKDTENLIANSFDSNNFMITQQGEVKRYKLSDINNETILSAYEQYKRTQERQFLLKGSNATLFFDFTEYNTDGINWIIITAIPESFFMNRIDDSIRLTIVLITLAMLLSTGIYFMVTKKLVQPIDTLIEVTEKFTSGDLRQRVAIVRNDEIGKLANAFNKMAATIYMLVDNLETTVQSRTAQLQKTNEDLKESKTQLRLILDSAVEAVYGMDKQGNCTFCNVSCIRMLGYKSEQDLLGKNMHYHIHHSKKDGTPIPISECDICISVMQGKGAHKDDEVFWRGDGTSFDVEYYAYPQYKDGEVVGAVVTFWDITERKNNNEKIKYLSCHDYLTGLYNRSCFENALIEIDKEINLPISIIFADVNGLKLTNDIFGHTAGDALIKKSAEVLKKVCREQDVVARVGGDEFILVLPNTQQAEAKNIINKIKHEISNEKIEAIKCSMSLGCATKKIAFEDIHRIIEIAEDQMYKDKVVFQKENKSELLDTIIDTLHKKSSAEKQHSLNVSQLCQRIGESLALVEADISKLKKVGFLHDIGKIVLNENILKKGDELADNEVIEMQQHPVIGYRILNLFDETVNLAEGVYSHHEKWDGSGYPKGIKGEQIPLISRIIAVAEAYDTIIRQRGDSEISQQAALDEIMELSAIKYDPKIVEVFVNMIKSNEVYSKHR